MYEGGSEWLIQNLVNCTCDYGFKARMRKYEALTFRSDGSSEVNKRGFFLRVIGFLEGVR